MAETAARRGTGAEADRLVIGIGNPDRGDDGAGRVAVRALAGRLPPGVGVREHSGTAPELVDWFAAAGAVWIVDAARSGAAPGTLRRFDAAAGPLPASLLGVSSHGLGLGTAVELARALGCLPRVCVVWGVEGARFDVGAAVTPAVAAAARAAAGHILAEVEATCTKPI